MKIDNNFIDNFNNIYKLELKDMKSKLNEKGIKFNNDQDVIYIYIMTLKICQIVR